MVFLDVLEEGLVMCSLHCFVEHSPALWEPTNHNVCCNVGHLSAMLPNPPIRSRDYMTNFGMLTVTIFNFCCGKTIILFIMHMKRWQISVHAAHTVYSCPFSSQDGNCYNKRKQEFQSSLVETTFDLKALASDLQQVETVSFQPVGPSVRSFRASTHGSLDKYYHFAEDYSDKHGVGYMWGLPAHVILDVNAVSGTWRGSG